MNHLVIPGQQELEQLMAQFQHTPKITPVRKYSGSLVYELQYPARLVAIRHSEEVMHRYIQEHSTLGALHPLHLLSAEGMQRWVAQFWEGQARLVAHLVLHGEALMAEGRVYANAG